MLQIPGAGLPSLADRYKVMQLRSYHTWIVMYRFVVAVLSDIVLKIDNEHTAAAGSWLPYHSSQHWCPYAGIGPLAFFIHNLHLTPIIITYINTVILLSS